MTGPEKVTPLSNFTRASTCVASRGMSHLTWSVVYTKWINLIGSYAKRKRVIGLEKVTPMLKFTRTSTSVASRGMRREQNWTAKVTDLENPMTLETSSSFRHRSSPVSPKAWTLYNCPKHRRSWKNTLGKLAVAVNQEAIGFEFWMKGALVTAEICVLFCWWFSNQFDMVSETPYSCYTVGCEL